MCVMTRKQDAIPSCFVPIILEGPDSCLTLKSNRHSTLHGS